MLICTATVCALAREMLSFVHLNGVSEFLLNFLEYSRRLNLNFFLLKYFDNNDNRNDYHAKDNLKRVCDLLIKKRSNRKK